MSKEVNEKKPFYKRWWFIAFAIVMVLGALGDIFGSDDDVDAEKADTEEVVAIDEDEESREKFQEHKRNEKEENERKEKAQIEKEKERAEEEKKEQERKEKEEEEEQEQEEASFDPADYNKELTYDDLARNPDDHVFKKVTFEGKIVQVMQGDDSTQFRLATNDDYDKMMYIEIDNSKLETRILEDDYIRIYGIYLGEISYESTMGGKITIPGVAVTEFEFQ